MRLALVSRLIIVWRWCGVQWDAREKKWRCVMFLSRFFFLPVHVAFRVSEFISTFVSISEWRFPNQLWSRNRSQNGFGIGCDCGNRNRVRNGFVVGIEIGRGFGIDFANWFQNRGSVTGGFGRGCWRFLLLNYNGNQRSNVTIKSCRSILNTMCRLYSRGRVSHQPLTGAITIRDV